MPQAENGMDEDAQWRGMDWLGPHCPLLERPPWRPLEIKVNGATRLPGKGCQRFPDPLVQRIWPPSRPDCRPRSPPKLVAGIADEHQELRSWVDFQELAIKRRIEGKAAPEAQAEVPKPTVELVEIGVAGAPDWTGAESFRYHTWLPVKRSGAGVLPMTDTRTASFTRMDQGTYEDYQLLEERYKVLDVNLVDEVLAMFGQLGGDPLGYKIDRLQHSLQTATRAQRDGADEETIVVALLHDIGDVLAPQNHSDLGAAILQPYVSVRNHWLLRHHGIFQGYYFWHHTGGDRNARDKYRGHPMFEPTAAFCEKWDQTSFDPDYDTLPLEAFLPKVRWLFARKPFDPSVIGQANWSQ